MPQLDLSSFPSQLFWLFISFAILYFGLAKFFLPKIAQILETRSSKVSLLLLQSESIQSEVEKIDQYINNRLAQAKESARIMVSNTTANINKIKAERELILEGEINNLLEKSKKNINEFKANAKKEIASISLEASKIALKEFVNLSINEEDLRTKITNMTRMH